VEKPMPRYFLLAQAHLLLSEALVVDELDRLV
jgi:hypothetical protein